jgi:sugar O-acyltransferase (sialic acid O-acetyltransferase NeuD family)
MKEEIYIIGAGGLGREMAATLSFFKDDPNYKLIGFIDDSQPEGKIINNFKVLGNIEFLKSINYTNALIGVGVPKIREQIFARLLSYQNISFPTIIHPKASIHSKEFVTIEKGCYIADGSILTTNISIGKFTYLLPGVTLSHDTTIGDFCTLMPGVRVCSGGTIGNGVTIGAGSIIAKPVTICDGTLIPPGSIITSNIESVQIRGLKDSGYSFEIGV